MNDKNTVKLCNDFPILYLGRGMDISKNLMPFGFECGDGWFDLIYKLSEKIEEYNRKGLGKDKITLEEFNDLFKSDTNFIPVIAKQVKEKYGGLRFYTNDILSDKITEDIDETEKLSYKTCEECGSTENVSQTNGWIQTICEKCLKYKKIKRKLQNL